MVDPAYVDASVFVKRYDLREPNAAQAVARMRATRLASSVLLLAETMSALARKVRSGELPAGDTEELRATARRDYQDVGTIEVSPDVLTTAEYLLFQHVLRAADALHLASALILSHETEAAIAFLTADRVLGDVGHAEGLAVEYFGPA